MSTADLEFRHLKPTGRHKQWAFVNPGGLEEVEVDVFDPEYRAAGVKVREERMRLGLTLREATRKAGLKSVSDLSGLERGRATCAYAELFRRWRSA